MAESLTVPFVDDTEAWITTPGGRLHTRRWNGPANDAAKPPTVLLYDSLGCVALWRDFPQHLAHSTGHVIIVYDRFGFDQPDAYPGQLDPSFIQQGAYGGSTALTDRLGVDRFIVFGHSVDGGMVVSIAAAYPGRCAGLIAESAQVFVEEQTHRGIRIAQAQFAEPSQTGRLERYHGSKAQWVLDAWVNTRPSSASVHRCLDDALLAVRSPVLALHGTEDEYGSTARSECIATLVGAPATLKLVQRCGYVSHREQEAAVLATVNAFLTASA